jgi:hypothetical protein
VTVVAPVIEFVGRDLGDRLDTQVCAKPSNVRPDLSDTVENDFLRFVG